MTTVAPAVMDEVIRRVAADLEVAFVLDQVEWDEVVGRCRLERLEGALLLAVEEGRATATSDQRDALLDAVAGSMERVVCLEAMAIGLVATLQAHGIEVRALKGLAAALLDAPAPWTRPFSDIDLLVRAEDMYEAYRLVEAAGFKRRFPEHAPGFDVRFGKGNEFVATDGWVIDVHRTFTFGALGQSVDIDGLWLVGEAINLGGVEVDALGREERFLHACVHAVASSRAPKWATLRDMASLMRSPIDPDRVVELADRWSYRAVLRAGVEVVRERLGVEPPPRCAARWSAVRPNASERAILRIYRTRHTGYRARTLTGITTAGGIRGAADFVGALADRPRRSPASAPIPGAPS